MGSVTFWGNKAGPCPRCGAMGDVIDGTWSAQALRALLQLDTSQLRTFGMFLDFANVGRSEEARNVAEKLPSDAQTIAISAVSSVHGKTMLKILASMLALVLWMYPNVGDRAGHDLNHLVVEAARYLIDNP